jgi:hypothetical protein
MPTRQHTELRIEDRLRQSYSDRLLHAMTVCIAGIWGRKGEGSAVTTISDLMMSDEQSSLDLAATKVVLLDEQRWMGMYAGYQGEFDELVQHINDYTKDNHTATVGDMITVVERAYHATLRHRIEATILHQFGMTLDRFLSDGLEKFGETYFRELAEEIRGIETGTDLLVAGYSSDGSPHVFRSDRRGQCLLLDAYQFGAVGTGSVTASGVLLSRSDFRHRSTKEKFAYRMCEAKFAAEGADGVGKETMVRILYHDGTSAGAILMTGTIRAAWDATRNPEIPDEVVDELEFILQTNPATRSRTGKRK